MYYYLFILFIIHSCEDKLTEQHWQKTFWVRLTLLINLRI